MYWRHRRFDYRSRVRTAALGLSILVHVVALVALTPWSRNRAAGEIGPSLGSGIDLVMVSEASLGIAAPQAPPMNDTVSTAPTNPPPVVATADDAEGGDARAPPQSSDPSRPPTPASPQRKVAWQRDGDARLDSSRDHEQRGAKETAGGDPTAASELLTQIARCLPAGLRPRLSAQRLVLKVATDGKLAAAPQIDSLVPILTAEDRAIADKVVQAALQCGPYTKADVLGQMVSVAVDFSDVKPARFAELGNPTATH